MDPHVNLGKERGITFHNQECPINNASVRFKSLYSTILLSQPIVKPIQFYIGDRL